MHSTKLINSFLNRQTGWFLAGMMFISAFVFVNCAGDKQVEKIPLEVLFGDPDSEAPRLAFTEEQYVYLAPHEGAMNLWYKTLDGSVDKPITSVPAPGIRYFYWVPNDEQVIYYWEDPETKIFSVYVVDVNSGESNKLAPPDGQYNHRVKVNVIETSHEYPDEILISMNLHDATVHDVYRVNTRTLAYKLIEKGDERVYRWISDWAFNIRGFIQLTESGGEAIWWRKSEGKPFEVVVEWGPEDVLNSGFLIATPDDKGMYLIDSKDRNTGALVTYYPETGERKVLVSDPVYDISQYMVDWKNHTVQAVGYQRARLEWVILDSAIAGDMNFLKKQDDGDLYVPDRLWDGRWWIVMYQQDTGPGSFYLYGSEDQELKHLFNYRPQLSDVRLAPMKPISFKARDGLTIHGYLTEPLNWEKPGPIVVNVHGGPWKRDVWGYHPEAQWLANRGYACLQINFRGSSGYGKDYINAGNREWGGAMLTDLVDGVNWAVEQGIADPERVAIYGGSYGGYAAMSALTFTPDIWKAGISVVGMPDLISYLNAIPAYWASARFLYDTRIGRLPRYESGPYKGQMKKEKDWTAEDRKDIEFLKARSPLYHVEAIQAPVLVAHGAKDDMVPIDQVNAFVKEAREAGATVEYFLYENEGHGIAHQENRLDFYRNMEEFLNTYLKDSKTD